MQFLSIFRHGMTMAVILCENIEAGVDRCFNFLEVSPERLSSNLNPQRHCSKAIDKTIRPRICANCKSNVIRTHRIKLSENEADEIPNLHAFKVLVGLQSSQTLLFSYFCAFPHLIWVFHCHFLWSFQCEGIIQSNLMMKSSKVCRLRQPANRKPVTTQG